MLTPNTGTVCWCTRKRVDSVAIVGSIKVNMRPVEEILRRKGLDVNGDVQRFHTANVLRRIIKYMPYRTGATIKLTQVQSPTSKPAINTFAPYARYLHEGKAMVNAVTGKGPPVIPGVGPRWPRGTKLKPTERPLTYTTSKNPEAGPYWGFRLKEKEGDAMLQDLKNYVRGRPDSE